MFLTDGLVYLAAKPTSCWTNNEGRGGRRNGVWERTQDAIYIFIYASVGFFFLILCTQQTENWGENGPLRLHLWGVFKEKISKPLSRDSEACHYSYLHWHPRESCRWMNGVMGCKSFVRHSAHQDLAVGFLWEKLSRFSLYNVLLSSKTLHFMSEMLEALIRLHLSVNCSAKWLIPWPRSCHCSPAHTLTSRRSHTRWGDVSFWSEHGAGTWI